MTMKTTGIMKRGMNKVLSKLGPAGTIQIPCRAICFRVLLFHTPYTCGLVINICDVFSSPSLHKAVVKEAIRWKVVMFEFKISIESVSYTHLTLPTILLV